MKIKEIVEIIGGKFYQNNEFGLDFNITTINSLEEASEKEITFFYDIKYKEQLALTHAYTVITEDKEEFLKLCSNTRKNAIGVVNVKKTIATLTDIFYKTQDTEWGINSFAYISPDVKISQPIFIAPFVYIGKNVTIDKGTRIFPFSYIGDNCVIKSNCTIYPNVTLYNNITIGNNVIIHGGSVIGVDGFGFYKSQSNVNEKICHVGKIEIEDNVEIFANVCIARATFGKTVIRKGTKLDNMVHIAHNVDIGENTLIAAQSGISGNANIGKNVILAGQVGIIDHINIGENSIITAQSGVAKDIPANVIYSGSPAMPHQVWKRLAVLLPKLPNILKKKIE